MLGSWPRMGLRRALAVGLLLLVAPALAGAALDGVFREDPAPGRMAPGGSGPQAVAPAVADVDADGRVELARFENRMSRRGYVSERGTLAVVDPDGADLAAASVKAEFARHSNTLSSR